MIHILLKRHRTRIAFIVLLGAVFGCGKTIDSSKSQSYQLKHGAIYYAPGGNSFERGSKRVQADPSTFKPIAESFGKDEHYVYFRASKQPNVDVASFVIEEEVPKDKNHVYYYSGAHINFNRNGEDVLSIVDGADPVTYQKLATPYVNFSRDKQNYYYQYQKLDIDYRSFRLLNDRFMMDKDFIYLATGKTLQKTSLSFNNVQAINKEYLLVDNQWLIYYQPYHNEGILVQEILPSALPVRTIGHDIATSKTSVYLFGKKMERADPASFAILNKTSAGLLSRDKNYIFFNSAIIPEADAATYQWLAFLVGKDKNNVYNRQAKIKVADIESFRVAKDAKNGRVIFTDKTGVVYDYKGDIIK